jgi:anti-sigma-K factor RskA
MQSELSALSKRIASVCYNRTALQRQLFENRNTRTDVQAWEIELKDLDTERDALVERQKQLFKSQVKRIY